MIRKQAEMRTEQREEMRGGQGTVTIRHHFDKDDFTAPVRLCATLSLPPGTGIGPHQHEKEDEVYLVTSGSGVLDDGNTRTRVVAGDAILTGNGASHAIHNDGDETLELTAVITCY